ncbi:3,4-dihydroxy 2-butanone 4-phosphate synthase/GTP cyclohydrolase II [Rhodoligotrophos appendicifer]|uniref:3,4-dihydroxy-2-butanone-4-phosphate synthase n=1 Tax=Rhodoligotrophos appendicifer TaxID=987056 RepID=UPI0011872BF5|nr:3,4-dihydroxy-2-butanone-4-phosphate synthase [Rhodoligotrophos appendicifer]
MTDEMILDPVDQAVAAVKAGEMVVVVDDADRENEGDLIMAAAKATPEQIAFMIRHTSGIVCTPLTAEEAKRLRLDPMVSLNDAPMGTAFTVSIDYRHGLTTGISSEERCNTVRALANGNAGADDFVRPGHVFPLIAKSGGVLMRSGHTEAAVDLARLAGFAPVGVIAELVNDDGSVKRGPEVLKFARDHGFKIISVNDLIAYRQSREKLVERTADLTVTTPIGPARAIAYATPFDTVQHLAIIFGDVSGKKCVPTRLHREDVLDDIFGQREVLTAVYKRFEAEGRGVLVYLREGAAGVPAADYSKDSEESEDATRSDRARAETWRDIGLGAQILRDLGVSSITLLATSTRHYVGLTGFGIEIEQTDQLDP